MPTIVRDNTDIAGIAKDAGIDSSPKFKTVKVLPKSEFGAELPAHEMITKLPNKAVGLVNDDMEMKVYSLPDGRFRVVNDPAWGSKAKRFHGEHSDLTSLITSAIDRKNKSEKIITGQQKAAHDKSLLGMLQKEFGDAFSTARSARSKSEYITHNPSGTKIRISDHALPLGYEQPDIDLPLGGAPKDHFAEVKKYLSPEEKSE